MKTVVEKKLGFLSVKGHRGTIFTSSGNSLNPLQWNSNSWWLLWCRWCLPPGTKRHQRPVVLLGEIKQNARLLWHQGIPVRPFFSLPSKHLLEFVHVRAPLGQVTCSKNDCSYWVCVLDANVIGVLLTDENNKVLAPEATTVNRVDGHGVAGWPNLFFSYKFF